MENTGSSYELLKIILEFVGTISWPITVLLMVIVFRRQIRKIVDNAKKVELPGGVSFEIEKEINQAKQLATQVREERNPETQNLIDKEVKNQESVANERMKKLGLKLSPSGLDLTYYKNIAQTDPRLALIGLRADFELMLRNLAKGFELDEYERRPPVFRLINDLYEKGAISTKQFDFIRKIFKISNSAAHGAEISKEQAIEILNIGQTLVEDYIAWLYWGFPND